MAGSTAYVYSTDRARPRRRMGRLKVISLWMKDWFHDIVVMDVGGKHETCGQSWTDHGEFGQCPDPIPQRPAPKRSIKTQGGNEVENLISDYVAVGGAPAIKVVVDDFYSRILDDKELTPYFEGIDLPRLKGHQAAFISEVMGGPKQYAGHTMIEAHQGRGITEDAFSRVAVHLLASLNAAGVPEEIATRTGQKAMALRDMVVHGQEAR